VALRGEAVELQPGDRQNVSPIRIEREGVLEGDGGNLLALGAKPARRLQLLAVEGGDDGLDGLPGELDGGRLRYPS
jgi:hypothetical protein